MESCRILAEARQSKFRFKNKLVSLDASIIDLCLQLYDCAHFRRTKGAVKLHLLLDHDGYLPSFAVLTEGKTHEIHVARQLRFHPGTIVIVDRGYTDYDWFETLTQQGVWFVTRMKENADYVVIETRPLASGGALRSDQVISLFQHARLGKSLFFRRIVFWDEKTQKELVFLTNPLKFAASTIPPFTRTVGRWSCSSSRSSSCARSRPLSAPAPMPARPRSGPP